MADDVSAETIRPPARNGRVSARPTIGPALRHTHSTSMITPGRSGG